MYSTKYVHAIMSGSQNPNFDTCLKIIQTDTIYYHSIWDDSYQQYLGEIVDVTCHQYYFG